MRRVARTLATEGPCLQLLAALHVAPHLGHVHALPYYLSFSSLLLSFLINCLYEHKTVINMAISDLKSAKEISARRPDVKRGRQGGLNGANDRRDSPVIDRSDSSTNTRPWSQRASSFMRMCHRFSASRINPLQNPRKLKSQLKT